MICNATTVRHHQERHDGHLLSAHQPQAAVCRITLNATAQHTTSWHRAVQALLVTTMLVAALCVSTTARAADIPMPNASMGPEDVVKIVVDALKTNNPAEDDRGIETVFAFASPGNRSVTGPLPRFKRMLKSGFADMLNHSNSEFSPIEIRDNKAWQAVWLALPNGEESGYLFQMGKQQSGEFAGMWMTEGVVPLPPRGQSI